MVGEKNSQRQAKAVRNKKKRRRMERSEYGEYEIYKSISNQW
jgi:hypothetical protein